MADPPSLTGAVKLTTASPAPRAAATLVGAPGEVAGITAEEAAEALPVPTLLVAVTVKV